MKLLKDFVSGKAKDGSKVDKFHVVGNKLVFRNIITESTNRWIEPSKAKRLLDAHDAGLVTITDLDLVTRLRERLVELTNSDTNSRDCFGEIKYRTLREETLAIRLATGAVIGNSARLELLGRKVAFGNVVRRFGAEHPIQRELATKAIMVPFSVFEQAGLDITTFEMIDSSGAETVKRKVPDGWIKDKQKFKIESVHFTGASLFRVSGKLYLFDIDRIEIKHGIFNPFLVQIPVEVKTVKDAYAALKPDLVNQAEAKGIKVKRQGEWFFIPTSLNSKMLDAALAKRPKTGFRDNQMYLKVGPNRPNVAEFGIEVNKKFYVKGKVSHTGREHKDQRLEGWHQAVPNTAMASFQITGDVD